MNGSTRTTLGENAYYKLDLILVLRIITKNNIYGCAKNISFMVVEITFMVVVISTIYKRI